MTEQERISDLEGQLSKALARVSELEALLLKASGSKNSQNSHLPPSVDIGRKNQSLRPSSDRPVGGQKGHKGHTLKMSAAADVVERLIPSYCNSCGASLADKTFTLQCRRQVIDIPPIVPVIKEYQSFGTVCNCGHHQCGIFPSGVENHIQYGPNIQSMVVYKSCYQYLPFHRLSDFFKKICHVNISKGTIENILRRSALKAQPVYQKLRNYPAAYLNDLGEVTRW
jgi:transposase